MKARCVLLLLSAWLFAQEGEVKAKSFGGAFLGITYSRSDRGLRIVDIAPGSPADFAGLKVADVIVRVNGAPPPIDAALKALWLCSKTALRIERGSHEIEVKLSLDDKDASPKVGEKAPDFALEAADGSGKVSLSNVVGEKPVVLIFGSWT